jgi:Tfp pilus assembly protein FimT
MVETLIVAGIVLVLTAVAVPIIHRGLQAYKLSSAATDIANIIQRTRYEAIRQNKITGISCRYQPQGSTGVIWIDLNNDTKLDATEPRVLLPPEAQVLPAGVAPGLSSMGTSYSNAVALSGTFSITFDSRGTLNPPAVYVIYLGSQQTVSTSGYKAITLTPTGRTKVWSASAYGSWYTN